MTEDGKYGRGNLSGSALFRRCWARLRHKLNMPVSRREELPALLDILGLNGTGVEVGLGRGSFSEILLKNSGLALLYSVDPYKEFGRDEYRDINNLPQAEQDERHETVKARFKKYGKRSVILRMTSERASSAIPSTDLDFVFIDANHAYEPCRRDLELWWPKVRKGGLFAGHDYLDAVQPGRGEFGVKRAVDAFAEAHRQRLFVTPQKRPTWYMIKT